ncbi:hypothetical protein [Spirosoma pollinicola]|uniref:Uncharacterized protein n=1 Tax=Spirosoma pollinicola TaxID=2057025 RepID=A0A2K8Z041_9BACT|nr:hypothetical protein [Spirosoma pollinicola]AUD03266.1 hypothetical protein CWM47_16350 [Spirosoma pollinicola]
MAKIEFLTDDDIEQLAWLRDELYPLAPSPSTDEERIDQFKEAIDIHRRYLFTYTPPEQAKPSEQELLTYLPFEQLQTNYKNEVNNKKATDSHLILEFTADQLKKVEHELALLDTPLAEMLYSIFLSGAYKEHRILVDDGLLGRFGVQNTALGADDGLLPARIATIWDRVLFKLYLQGEQNRKNGLPTNRVNNNRSYHFENLMSDGRLDKLFEELMSASKLLDLSTDKQEFIANLTGDNTEPIIWVGGNGQLAYLIQKLVTNGLLGAKNDSLWAATEQHFIGTNDKRFNNLVRDRQMYEQNRSKKPKRGNEIDAIIEVVKLIE